MGSPEVQQLRTTVTEGGQSSIRQLPSKGRTGHWGLLRGLLHIYRPCRSSSASKTKEGTVVIAASASGTLFESGNVLVGYRLTN